MFITFCIYIRYIYIYFQVYQISISLLTNFCYGNPKIEFLRDCKNSDNILFQIDKENDARNLIDSTNPTDSRNLTDSTKTSLGQVFLRQVDYHAPKRKRIPRVRVIYFMNKALRKEMMLRSKITNLYLAGWGWLELEHL